MLARECLQFRKKRGRENFLFLYLSMAAVLVVHCIGLTQGIMTHLVVLATKKEIDQYAV
jgi:hypothetical protein